MLQAVREFLRRTPEVDNATHFVVVSLPRTGTHMLRTLLNEHPNIRTETELFNEHSKPCRKWSKRSAQWVLSNIAWRKGPQQIRGCMIHLCHGYQWGIWQHLMSLDDVRYVCLKRENLLEQYLSLQQALVHKKWQTYRHQKTPPVQRMELKPEDAKRYFGETQDQWAEFERAFCNRPRCYVSYEELCGQKDAASRRVQEFLGAQFMADLQSDTVKVGRPARELIGNYDELREYFAGTPYYSFFTPGEAQPRRMAA